MSNEQFSIEHLYGSWTCSVNSLDSMTPSIVFNKGDVYVPDNEVISMEIDSYEDSESFSPSPSPSASPPISASSPDSYKQIKDNYSSVSSLSYSNDSDYNILTDYSSDAMDNLVEYQHTSGETYLLDEKTNKLYDRKNMKQIGQRLHADNGTYSVQFN